MGVGFLTNGELKDQIPRLLQGEPFDESRVSGASYDLTLGEEVYISGKDYPQILSSDEPFVDIPRGQFALLTTRERIAMPRDYFGLISIKFGKKAQGLINVSGFHVDPDYNGKIVFSVFNAGPTDVVLRLGEPVFMIFFYQLAHEAKKRSGQFNNMENLRPDLVASLKGTSASLTDVDRRVRRLEAVEKVLIGLLVALATGLIALFLR